MYVCISALSQIEERKGAHFSFAWQRIPFPATLFGATYDILGLLCLADVTNKLHLHSLSKLGSVF